MSVEARHRPRGTFDAEPREASAAPGPIEKAAIVLVGLDDELAREVLARLAPDEVETLTAAAERLETVDPATRRVVGREFYKLALRRAAFGFDDIEHLADVDLRAAYREEDAATWALALAGAARTLGARVLGALGGPASASLREAMGRVGAFRLDAVEAAQAEVVTRVRRLHDEALVDLPEPRGREEIVV